MAACRSRSPTCAYRSVTARLRHDVAREQVSEWCDEGTSLVVITNALGQVIDPLQLRRVA